MNFANKAFGVVVVVKHSKIGIVYGVFNLVFAWRRAWEIEISFQTSVADRFWKIEDPFFEWPIRDATLRQLTVTSYKPWGIGLQTSLFSVPRAQCSESMLQSK